MNFTIPEKQKVGHHVVIRSKFRHSRRESCIPVTHKDLLFPTNFKELFNILQHGVQHTPKDGRDLKT